MYQILANNTSLLNTILPLQESNSGVYSKLYEGRISTGVSDCVFNVHNVVVHVDVNTRSILELLHYTKMGNSQTTN